VALVPVPADDDAAGSLPMMMARDEVAALSRDALAAAGAGERVARLLTAAALFSQDRGVPAVGISHLLDHVDALREGRLDGRAHPQLHRTGSATLVVDARGGIPHTGFEKAFPSLVSAAREHGVACFGQRAAFTCGGLGWYTHRLAETGLVALAMATSPALMAAAPGGPRVFGTNPLAFSVPQVGRSPLTIDQASSAVAWVRVRDAVQRGEAIPEGWALDSSGTPTVNADEALQGVLLPFGGYKGGNIALLVELLASMAGGSWSLDAAPFERGSQSPDVGMLVLVIDPTAFHPGFLTRATEHLDRLSTLGVHMPGRDLLIEHPEIRLPATVAAQLRLSASAQKEIHE